MRHKLQILCCALSTLMTPPCMFAQKPRTVAAKEIDRTVITALSRGGQTKPQVISHIDLSGPFSTVSQWTFVAVQEPAQQSADNEEHGPIHLCLVKVAKPDCSESFYEKPDGEQPPDSPYHLFASTIVYASENKSSPLLFVEVCGEEMFDGNCEIATALYRYDSEADRFVRVFLGLTGRNNNEDTRFVEHGPLRGDVIVVYPTQHAPYTYWVELYKAAASGQYGQILRYRGRTVYGDGNPLAVADSEMPELLRHLGLWQPGDALPVPAHLPHGCSHLSMRKGEEWCK